MSLLGSDTPPEVPGNPEGTDLVNRTVTSSLRDTGLRVQTPFRVLQDKVPHSLFGWSHPHCPTLKFTSFHSVEVVSCHDVVPVPTGLRREGTSVVVLVGVGDSAERTVVPTPGVSVGTRIKIWYFCYECPSVVHGEGPLRYHRSIVVFASVRTHPKGFRTVKDRSVSTYQSDTCTRVLVPLKW